MKYITEGSYTAHLDHFAFSFKADLEYTLGDETTEITSLDLLYSGNHDYKKLEIIDAKGYDLHLGYSTRGPYCQFELDEELHVLTIHGVHQRSRLPYSLKIFLNKCVVQK